MNRERWVAELDSMQPDSSNLDIRNTRQLCGAVHLPTYPEALGLESE